MGVLEAGSDYDKQIAPLDLSQYSLRATEYGAISKRRGCAVRGAVAATLQRGWAEEMSEFLEIKKVCN